MVQALRALDINKESSLLLVSKVIHPTIIITSDTWQIHGQTGDDHTVLEHKIGQFTNFVALLGLSQFDVIHIF